MLHRCYNAEKMKMKSPVLLFIFLFIPLFPAIMGTFNYLNNLSILHDGWYSLWTQHTLFYTNFFFAPMIAVYASYLWRLEHKNHNWNKIMTAPVPFYDLLLAKFLCVTKIMLATQLWVFLLFILCGKLAHLPGMVPSTLLIWMLRGCIGSLGIISLQLLLSMCIRSFSVPIIIALFGSILSLPLVNQNRGLFWPYALMLLGMNSNHSEDRMTGSGLSYLVVSVLFTLLFIIISCLYKQHHDVKA